MKIELWIGTALAGCALAAAAGDLPRMTPAQTDLPPKIDGKLDDAVWQAAAQTGPFTMLASGRPVADTRARLAYDGQWLYLALACDNPHMNFLNQLGQTRDDPGLFKDDSIEIFLTREGLNRYFHYILNFANVQAERRIVGAGRDFGWSYPWVSATEKTAEGWTAEIAIPLDAINGDQPGDIRFNLLRNKIEIELDAMGAKNSEKLAHSFWAPVENGAHEPERFGVIAGLQAYQAAPPFLPRIAALKTANLDFSGEQFRFDAIADIAGRSPVAGRARLAVIERLDDGEKILAESIQELPPRCEKTIAITVPVADFSPKKLALRLTDQATGMQLDEQALDFQGNLITEAYPEFSFYSGEKTFRVKAVLALTEAARSGLTLALQDAAGKVVAATDQPARETVLTADGGALPAGASQFLLALKQPGGKTLGTYAIKTLRVAPAPGGATKVDHFRRIVRLNGEPFFPFGIYANGALAGGAVTEALMRQAASALMNTVIGGALAFNSPAPEAALQELAAAAGRHGLYFGFWPSVHHVIRGMPAAVKTYTEKQGFAAENYARDLKPRIESAGAVLRGQPRFLFWYGWDEPNLHDWQLNLYVQKLLQATVKAVDPYHVMFGLYARYIPPAPEAVEFFDMLGYDVYTYTHWEGQYADVCGAMAAQTAQLDARAAERRQPVWMVPMGTALDPVRVPRVLSGPEQLCQSYAAIIYGARGLLYFHYNSTYGRETWAALRALGEQVQAFAPAVLHDPVEQAVAYAAGNFDVARWQCPPVPFRFFRFPDGRLMALAVNAKNCPVDVTFKITGLRGVRRMFGDQTACEVGDGGFPDKLEPFAVRAYALDVDEKPGQPLAALITDTAHPELAQTLVSNDTLVKQARARKNLVLNPSLEAQKVAGLPDFCVPYRVMESEDIGEKGSRWFLDADNPKFGKVSLRMSRYPFKEELKSWRAGAFGAFAQPRQPEAHHVFSFYARAASDNAKLWAGISTAQDGAWDSATFTLTKDWQRYSMPAAMTNLPPWHACASFLVQPVTQTEADDVIWVDGFQLEEGTVPTEFEGE